MKYSALLLLTLLMFLSSAYAQEIKQPLPGPETSANIFTSSNKPKRIDPNFPVQTGNSQNQSQTSPYVRPDAKTRAKRYADSSFGISALISAATNAVFKEITNSPREWHRTTEGFAKRFASSYAERAIGRTITYGINEAFKLDDHFEKSGKKGFGKRFKNVLAGSFTTRTKTGKRIPDFPGFIGSYSANIIAKETWYPDRYNYKDGITSGTLSIFTRLGVNFLREFFF